MTVALAQTTRDLVTVSGPDAATYLQGQLSQDVAGLAVGASAPAFVLAPQGKVEGWGRVHRRAEDHFVIDVDPGAGEAWETRLRRFLLRTKAEITTTPEVGMVALRGDGAAELCRTAGQLSGTGEDSGWLEAHWPGTEGRDLIGASPEVIASLVEAEAVRIGAEDLEARRIRAGVPRWGAELDVDTIPAAAGQWVIDASVSFTKGCYTGQELVARVDSRGNNVPRRLEGLIVDGVAPMVGTAITVDGEVVGSVTSSASDSSSGRAVALAYVARAVSVPSEVHIGDWPARLENLPMVAAD